ncbi:aldo/keto reductase [Polymorphobacter fuscus]|uniref:Aldo/keto reductase n=1 Tax=Sandarakinorhabdus fusca TaxID=1439888 RepID=A0A7C9GQU3_9SPHN|nr:aldo/keto reductase [Polymorphobacter fuscus]KAB7645537.1 aldo/keto reductase [Polymorphobacter fuscus]MQT17976.1 aldo/keto reductase [Polymorphobacter fuscus]NJC08606.1 aryl-alcohol dehydrogenase-like predicted oxidoreductase [Polymorphobacter fuscus]
MTFTERFDIAPDANISRVIRGGWQLAGDHGAVDAATVTDDLAAFYDAGITTFDCADIYTGVETMIGDFRAALLDRRGADALARLRVHTKFVPDLALLPHITSADVRRIIDRSLTRLRTDRLDLVQFHWWDYDQPRYLDTARHLADLQAEGKIGLVGGTNFDAGHVREIADAGVPFATLQVQYSLLDTRPAGALADVCGPLGTHFLCYGALAGGFLTDRWLGQPESTALTNRSLVKYKLIIDDFGGWDLFQALLATLRRVADRHSASIANIAARHVLDLPLVAGVIVGASHARHLPDTLRIGDVRLTPQDRADIDTVLARRQGPTGEVYALERDRTGRHGSIMKYNLGDAPARA